MTTIGWGDIVPQNRIERIYCTFAMLITVVIYGMCLGVFTTIVGRLYTSQREHTELRRNFAVYMRWRSFDGELKKILEQCHAEKLGTARNQLDARALFAYEKDLLAELNSATRLEVHRARCRPVVDKA